MPEDSNPLIRALSRRDQLSAEERGILSEIVSRERTFAAGEEIVREGSTPTESCLILEGFAARSNLLGDGKRQLSALHVAGDFIDLHSLLLRTMDHSVVALTQCRIGLVPHRSLMQVTLASPHLTRLLWMITVIDAAAHRAWVVGLGRRSPLQRLAHLLCEVFLRLQAVGLTQDRAFHFPITQQQIADMMGVSLVHVNRTLQELRGTGFISWREQTVTISNWERLQELAEFDPTYLSLEKQPR
ncbi:MAG: Crp/Fnr family transcriptional regulator [Pseudaminobacter sp.]|nr:Crp/Fnr family transcriptional regulator [Pseudaminobacter sp.]